MKTFILILYLTTHWVRGAVTTSEFSSETACHHAGMAAKATFEAQPTTNVMYVCVEK